MAIRKSMEENIIVEGGRGDWLSKIQKALEISGFKNVKCNSALYQTTADYKKATVFGEVLITLKPSGLNDICTEIVIKSTANVDNIYALFKSPNKTIIGAFKSGLN